LEDQDASILIFSDFIYEREGNSFYTDDSYLIFLNQVGSHFTEKTYLGRNGRDELKEKSFKVSLDDANFVELPFYSSLKKLHCLNISKLFQLIRNIHRAIKKSDVLWIAWPHPISLLILLLQIGRGKRVVLNVRCDLAKLVKIRYKGLFRFFALRFIGFGNTLLSLFFEDVLVLTTGTELKEMYAKIVPINLLSVGRLEPEKGIEYLLEAIPLIRERCPVNLCVIGDGKNKEELTSLTKKLGIADAVKFHGFIPFGEELLHHYKRSDIFVLPSLSEGLPRVVNEVRAFGLPIVSTDIGGLKSELTDQQNCLKINARSPKDISKKIISLAENKNLYQNISEKLYCESTTNNLEYQGDKVLSLILSSNG
jgi:glycosyltransferase involved in cell wall biosynthesis